MVFLGASAISFWSEGENRLGSGIEGKVAVVTGASRGIGAATARMLAANGAAKVVLHYNSYKEGAEQVASELKAKGCAVELVQANLGTEQGIRDLIAALPTLAPEVDILINNAGHLVKRTKLAEFTMELWNEVMDLNAKSVYFMAQAVVPAMIAKGSGHIINISSIAARNGGGPANSGRQRRRSDRLRRLPSHYLALAIHSISTLPVGTTSAATMTVERAGGSFGKAAVYD